MTLDEHLLSGVEHHPLEPFLPENAVLLMLGSFPPQKKRWSMDFFYPNLQNDMWRIFGFIFFDDKDYFLSPEKIFDKERIIAFCMKKGLLCTIRLRACAGCRIMHPISFRGGFAHGYWVASSAASFVSGGGDYRSESDGCVLRTDGSKRAASRRRKYVSFQRSRADPLSDAVFQSGLPFKA